MNKVTTPNITGYTMQSQIHHETYFAFNTFTDVIIIICFRKGLFYAKFYWFYNCSLANVLIPISSNEWPLDEKMLIWHIKSRNPQTLLIDHGLKSCYEEGQSSKMLSIKGNYTENNTEIIRMKTSNRNLWKKGWAITMLGF